MVNAADSAMPRNPGTAFWLLVLLGLPALGVVVISLVLFGPGGGGFHGTRAIVCAVAGAPLAAAVLGWLPRLRRMARRARWGWALSGVALAFVLSGGYTAALVLAALIYACEFGESCLT
jgi:hypothetical protein